MSVTASRFLIGDDGTMLPTSPSDVLDEAVALGHRWVEQASSRTSSFEQRRSALLARLAATADGAQAAVRFLDEMAAAHDQQASVRALRRLADHPGFAAMHSVLGKSLVGVGSGLGQVAPGAAASLLQRNFRRLFGHLLVTSSHLTKHRERAHARGMSCDVSVLGEETTGHAHAASHREDVVELLQHSAMDRVSVKLSALVPHLSSWDIEGSVERAIAALEPICAAMSATPSSITIDSESSQHVAIAVRTAQELLARPPFSSIEIGLTIPAYLPEAAEVLELIMAAATERVARGGARTRIRLVKGGHLEAEHAYADQQARQPAPYADLETVDAAYIGLVDRALQPDIGQAVSVSIATHNPFDAALGFVLARRRSGPALVETELLQGVAPALADVIRAEGGPGSVALYTPVLTGGLETATAYLTRRVLEQTRWAHSHDSVLDERLRAAVAAGPPKDVRSTQPTDAVSLGSFTNAPVSDPRLASVRQMAIDAAGAAVVPPLVAPVSSGDIAALVARAMAAGTQWGVRSGAQRGAVLQNLATDMEAARSDLVAAMAADAQMSLARADRDVSTAIDYARYYGEQAAILDEYAVRDGLRAGSAGVVLVVPARHAPVASAVGGMCAALASGAAAILKPAPGTGGCLGRALSALVDGLERQGASPDLLHLADPVDESAARALVVHQDIATVVLAGSTQTAQRFSRWRADRPEGARVFAHGSAKNAMVIMPDTDIDHAVREIVSSAFGYAGQDWSATSLVIAVGSADQTARLKSRLTDAVSSVPVGTPKDRSALITPLIEPARGAIADALTQLQPGETWLVEPQQLDQDGALWSPGLKDGVQSGSRFHVTETPGPVLGIMNAPDLGQAIEWQNSTGYGHAGAIFTIDDDDISEWARQVEVANIFINRRTLPTLVGRQPLGGWKRSVVGPGAHAGGPHYVAHLVPWEQESLPRALGEVGPRVTAILHATHAWLSEQDWHWLAVAAGSDAQARDHLARGVPSGTEGAESTVISHLPVPGIRVRAGTGATAKQVLRVLLAAECAGVPAQVSVSPQVQLPEQMEHWGREQNWVLESDDDLVADIADGQVRGRIRAIGDASALWRASVASRANVTILDGDVLAAGSRELLAMVREQVATRSHHRHGQPVGAGAHPVG